MPVRNLNEWMRSAIGRHRVSLVALAVGVLALSLRLLHLSDLSLGMLGSGVFEVARGDASTHWNEAREILAGNWLLRGVEPWKGPGLSYWLAGWMPLVGENPGDLRYPQAFLGSASCALLVVVARRVLSLPWACVAGVLAAVHGTAIVFDGEISIAPLVVFLILLSIVLLPAGPQSARWRHFASACAAGLACVSHATLMLPSALVAAFVLRRRGVASAGSFVLGLAVVIGAVAAQNTLVRGVPVLVSSNGGINVYLGNQPGFDQTGGQSTSSWDRVFHWPADMGIEDPVEADRYYVRQALRFALEEPVTTVEVLFRKLRVLLSPLEVSNNFRIYELREHSRIARWFLSEGTPPVWPWGVLAPLGLVGLWLMLRDGSDTGRLLVLWGVGISVAILASFVTARFRLPVSVLLTIPTAYFLRFCASRVRGDRMAGARAAGAALALALLLHTWGHMEQKTLPGPIVWQEAVTRAGMGQRGAARIALDEALELHPDDTPLRRSAAQLAIQLQRTDLARALLEELVAETSLDPDQSFIVADDLALLYYWSGDPSAALELAERNVRSPLETAEFQGHPFFPLDGPPLSTCRARLLVALLQGKLGDRAGVAEILEDVREECGSAGRVGQRLEWVRGELAK